MSGDEPDAVSSPTDADSLARPPGDAGDDWTVHETELVWENPFFTAGYDVVERPDGSTGRYYWVDPGDVAIVVALTDDDEVLLVEQYSVRQDRSLLTCPGGVVEDGESFVEAGARELAEETGFRAGETHLLETYCPDGWVRMVHAVVFATDLEPGPHSRESGEDIAVHAVPVEEAVAAVRSRSPAYGGGLAPLLVAREAGLL